MFASSSTGRPTAASTTPMQRRWRRLRRRVLLRRRLLAAVAAGLAVLLGLHAVSPPAPPTRAVLVAARDLPPGAVVDASDVTTLAYAPGTVPAGAVRSVDQVVGRTTTGPILEREAFTGVRLVSGSLLAGYPGRVAAPVRIVDVGAVSLLSIGDRVDVVAADPQGREEPVVVARDVPVVALPPAEDASLSSGGLVVLAVADQTARALAGAAVSSYLSVVLTQ